jgi:hypothetical protein
LYLYLSSCFVYKSPHPSISQLPSQLRPGGGGQEDDDDEEDREKLKGRKLWEAIREEKEERRERRIRIEQERKERNREIEELLRKVRKVRKEKVFLK